jgi:flagellar hook-length control protein FliK
MNDMRLPGLDLSTADPASGQGGTEPARDPAQAFDAVMSRFSREQSGSNGAQNAPAQGAANAARPNKQASAPGNGDRLAQANAKPAARSGCDEGDDESAETAAAPGIAADPSVLVAVVADSAQLGAQAAALAAAAQNVAQQAPAARESGASTAATTLEALAAQAGALGAHAADKPAADPSKPLADEKDPATPAPAAGAARRQAAPARETTLRFEAPVARPLDVAKLEIAQPFANATTAAGPAAVKTHAAQPGDLNTQVLVSVASGTTAPATYSIAHATVAAPVGGQGFAHELAQRVVVFAGQKVQRAEISVTPADLGPIAVSIEVRGQEATLAFSASHHATRAAIEDALPRLRDMLSAQGLHLAGSHVGSEPRRDPYRPSRADQGKPGVAGGVEGVASDSQSSPAAIRRGLNLIDIVV